MNLLITLLLCTLSLAQSPVNEMTNSTSSARFILVIVAVLFVIGICITAIYFCKKDKSHSYDLLSDSFDGLNISSNELNQYNSDLTAVSSDNVNQMTESHNYHSL